MNKMNKRFRSLFKAVLVSGSIMLMSNTAHAIPVGFDATNGTWIISATDNAGLSWDGSTLTFESQVASGAGFLLEGYFFWEGSNGSFGRENFTGTLSADNSLNLSGFELVAPASGIVTANYFAILDDLGTNFINGSWSGSGIPSDDWSASLQSPVPVPGAIWLFASGLIGLAGVARKTVST